MSTRTHHGRIIETSIRMKTTPMRAWLAWADPQHIANWFVDRADGEARPGGTMRWFFDTFGLRPLYATEAGRRRWLEPDVAAGGAVLCDMGTEIVLAVDGSSDVIALKAFAMGPATMLALDFSCWPEAPIDTTDVEARLNRALDRLVALL